MESTKRFRDLELTAIKTERARLILNSAYKLYLESGIAHVEMKHIASEAKVSRATLYRYFPSKLNLTFAVLKQMATDRMVSKYRVERQAFEGNGYEKFTQFVDQIIDAYQKFPDFFRFTAMVENHYGSQLPAQEQAAWYRQLYPGLFLENTPQLFLEKGQQDGSVRQDIDPHLYLATVLVTRSLRWDQKVDEQGKFRTHNRVCVGQQGISLFRRPPRIVASWMLGILRR